MVHWFFHRQSVALEIFDCLVIFLFKWNFRKFAYWGGLEWGVWITLWYLSLLAVTPKSNKQKVVIKVDHHHYRAIKTLLWIYIGDEEESLCPSVRFRTSFGFSFCLSFRIYLFLCCCSLEDRIWIGFIMVLYLCWLGFFNRKLCLFCWM